jgi:beta-lactamase class A
MSLRDYAALMIMTNDNTAANLLTDILGMENVNESLAAQGTPEIKFRRRAISRRDAPTDLPENEGTPRSVMRALELIYRGKVVDRATSDAILELLALPESVFFHRELPPNVRFAGESGSSPGMRCEEGIVLLPGRPYVFCVMITGGTERSNPRRERGSTDDLLEKLSRAALDYFTNKEVVAGSKNSRSD